MTETIEEVVNRVMHWHPMTPVMKGYFDTVETFHEWAVDFAIKKFKAKTMENNQPLSYYLIRRPDMIHTLEGRHQNEDEKRRMQYVLRYMCMHVSEVSIISSVNEIWIGPEMKPEDLDKYDEIRNLPGREDGLMVNTEHRNGDKRTTKWVVKLKHNPANNRILARDDIHDEEQFGYNVGWFHEVRWPEGSTT